MTQSNNDNLQPKTESDNLQQKVEKLGEFSISLLRSLPLFRTIGYGLVILFFFDLLEILIPPQFLNPEWEFRAMGQIVERIAVPLLGLLFIFYGENNLRTGLEKGIVKTLSWLTLVGGILLFLLIPLGAVNTFRLNQANNAQINAQIEQGLNGLKNAQQRIQAISSKEEMQALIAQLQTQGAAPEIKDITQVEQVKQELSTFIDQSRSQLMTQAEVARNQKQILLVKSSVKWNLGALISGFLLITAWRLTKWAR